MLVMSRIELYFSFEYSHYIIASENIIYLSDIGIEFNGIKFRWHKIARQF